VKRDFEHRRNVAAGRLVLAQDEAGRDTRPGVQIALVQAELLLLLVDLGLAVLQPAISRDGTSVTQTVRVTTERG